MKNAAVVRIEGRAFAYDDSCAESGANDSQRVVVLLHAFPFDRAFWHDVARALAHGARVIVPDLRGFGASPLGAPPMSIAGMADDVARLLEHLNVARATLVGLSMGGYVALAFADAHADKLDGLVLCDTKAGPDTAEARAARSDAIALVHEAGVAAYFERQLPKLLAAHAPESVRARAREIAHRQTPDAVVAGLEALRDRPDRRAQLARIVAPTLIIVGAHDAVTPPSEARAMAEALPHASVAEIENAGHLANLECPEAFCRVLTSHLRG